MQLAGCNQDTWSLQQGSSGCLLPCISHPALPQPLSRQATASPPAHYMLCKQVPHLHFSGTTQLSIRPKSCMKQVCLLQGCKYAIGNALYTLRSSRIYIYIYIYIYMQPDSAHMSE